MGPEGLDNVDVSGRVVQFGALGAKVAFSDEIASMVDFNVVDNSDSVSDIGGFEPVVVVTFENNLNPGDEFKVGFTVDEDLSDKVLALVYADTESPGEATVWSFASTVGGTIDNAYLVDTGTGMATRFEISLSTASSYALIVVPEPQTYAMIFGAVALALTAYIRRQRH